MARDWSPRFWNGADAFAWLRLLAENHFAVEPKYAYIAAIVSANSLANTAFGWLQHAEFGDRIRRTRIVHPPLFVLGHWRTGTTLLHELLILDEKMTSPTSHDCFMPCHLLLSRRFFRTAMQWAQPEKRPMDNMAAGWDRPQEDEFALALLGEPSTYSDVAFPNRPGRRPGSLDLSDFTPAELAKWKRTLKRFVQTLTLRDSRRLVLKSPPHTARIPALLDLYPDAKFVHIKRDPYTLFASTVNLWTAMARKHGFQTPRSPAAVEEKVFREFQTIYRRLFEAVPKIPTGNYIELRYEDLVKDLVGQVERVYLGLGLDGFPAAKSQLEAYAARSKGYETNKYTLTAEQRSRIDREWGEIIQRLGYFKS